MNRLQREAMFFEVMRERAEKELAQAGTETMRSYFRGRVDAYSVVARYLSRQAVLEPDHEELGLQAHSLALRAMLDIVEGGVF